MTDTDPNMTPIGEEKPYDPKLSTVSQAYDRGQKGYLDDTEKKLRALDTENAGELDLNRMYELMRTMESEQKKALSLKRVVIALVCFSVLLALANIGTSFAAATLAKDTSANADGDLIVIGSNQRVGVSWVTDVVEMDGGENLTQGERMLANFNLGGEGGAGTRSPLQISQNKADTIMKDLCGNNWPGISKWNCNQGSFSCNKNGQSSTITGCTEGYQTTLSWRSKPTCQTTNGAKRVVFSYEARRGNWAYGTVQFSCPKNIKDPCEVLNVQCKETCSLCAEPSGTVNWFCDPGAGCGCEPGSCPVGVNQTCYQCYNGASNARRMLTPEGYAAGFLDESV